MARLLGLTSVFALGVALLACTALKAPSVDAGTEPDGRAEEEPRVPLDASNAPEDGLAEDAPSACANGTTKLCACGDAVGGERLCIDSTWGPCQISCGALGAQGVCADGKQVCDDETGTWGLCSVGGSDKDLCTGLDDDCDGTTDQGCECRIGDSRTCAEGNLFGPCAAGMQSCEAPGRWGACSIPALTADTCEPGNDANCNGSKNENCPCVNGTTRACSDGGLFGRCAAGTQTCQDGKYGACSISPLNKDSCLPNNDDTCNGSKNEGCSCVSGASRSCAQAGARGTCATGTQTCSMAGTWGACSIAPATKDGCALGNDDTCDGVANGGCICIVGDKRPCSTGGYKGTCAGGEQKCVAPGAWETSCSIMPKAEDSCVTPGNDDDCDGVPEEGCFEKMVFTEPVCIYRPDHPNQHHCGPAGTPLYMSVDLKTSGFCGDQYNQNGIFTIEQARLDETAWSAAATGLKVNAPVEGVAWAYLPGGQAGYDAAPSGKVALTIWTSQFANEAQNSSVFHIENIHEYLVAQGQMPYTIAVFMSDDLKADARIAQLRDVILPMLAAKWPKLSQDPNYRAIAGQSTAGGNAFDTVWMGTNLVAKGLGGSPSLVCFTCLGGRGPCADSCPEKNSSYVSEIAFCPARAMRFSATVGTCDIFASLVDRTMAGCGSSSGPGSVDGSGCGADWLKANENVANAMLDKGVPYQLFKINDGRHVHATWAGWTLPYQLRWLFKDITCAK